MADKADDSKHHSFIEKIEEKIEETFHAGNSSSSDSDSEKAKESDEPTFKDKIWRLFGRQRPVHHVLGGGKPADVLLWRNKKISATVLGAATAVYFLFEVLEYHLLTLLCHVLMLSLTILFVYSKSTAYVTKSSVHIPELVIPEKIVIDIAMSTRYEINRALFHLREIASGKDLKRFFVVIAGLWVLSIVGSWCSFLTLAYTIFVLLHTVPVLYEKYEDEVDQFGEMVITELKRLYAMAYEMYLSKTSGAPLMEKKLL